MRRRAVLLLALALPAAVASRGRATVIEAMDLRDLVRGADHIVLGTVTSAEARYDALGRIVTDATLRVEESLHGPARAGTEVVLRRLGGAIGEIGLHVEGEPVYVPGERLIVFAHAVRSEPVLRAVGMSQGVLPVRFVDGAERVLPGGRGLALVRRGADGRLHPAPAAIGESVPLEELLAQVRELVAQIHAAR